MTLRITPELIPRFHAPAKATAAVVNKTG